MTNAKPRISQVAKGLAATALMALVPSAFAATTWNMQNTCTTQTVGGSTTSNTVGSTTYTVNNVGNTLTCGTGTKGVASDTQSLLSVSAFSTASSSGSTLTAGSTFATASVQLYSGNGVGVVNRYEDANSPTHTADNQNGTDLVLLNFGSTKYNLSNVTVGWWANDYDITVLAYTGTGVPTIGALSSLTAANGWTSIRNYGSAGTTSASNTGGTGTDVSLNTNDTTTYSSWWIISAYNSSYGGTNSLGTDTISDFIKIASVAGTAQSTVPGTVPEPGSLALIGTALMGFVAVRRRKQKQQDAA